MKIQCDVCNKDEASVFCTADEAALCDACNHRVHRANKLASKHHRFSLLHPTANDFPICDICKERRAFLFCQQDRAILCRECDISIHTANDHTLKHNRFLLTGVKLSATSSAADTPTKQPCVKKTNPNSVSSATAHKSGIGANQLTETSSISEYLIETIPGWRVDDFLDPSSVPLGFSKTLDDGMLRFADTDFERSGIWVPESPEAPLYHASHAGWLKETAKEAIKGSNNNTRWSDDGFTVPQISPPSIGSNKRSRPFWYLFAPTTNNQFCSGHQFFDMGLHFSFV